MKSSWQDIIEAVIECGVTLWQLCLFLAFLPIIATAALIFISAPLWLGWAIWGFAIDIFRLATSAPELPEQVSWLINLL